MHTKEGRIVCVIEYARYAHNGRITKKINLHFGLYVIHGATNTQKMRLVWHG